MLHLFTKTQILQNICLNFMIGMLLFQPTRSQITLCLNVRNIRKYYYRIGGVMVSVFASSAVDRGFEPRSGQPKDYKIGICYFSARHTASRRKGKYWLAQNQDNVSEWGDMSIRGL
jgi:hypothetical protein